MARRVPVVSGPLAFSASIRWLFCWSDFSGPVLVSYAGAHGCEEAPSFQVKRIAFNSCSYNTPDGFHGDPP